MQRGTCSKCGQTWVLGKVDVNSGWYGHFFCGACWESGDFSDTDTEMEDASEAANQRLVVGHHLKSEKTESFTFRTVKVGVSERERRLRFVNGYWSTACEGPTTGFTLWLGSQVLLDYLEKILSCQGGKASARGLRVLELGAGCGLPGLGLAQLGAEVVLTDVPGVRPLLECHADLNFSEDSRKEKPRVATLRWGHAGDLRDLVDSEQPRGAFDYVIGSEIGYDKDANAALMYTLQTVMAIGNMGGHREKGQRQRVILTLAQRQGEMEEFTEAAAQAGWSLCIHEMVDIEALTGVPCCSPVAVVEMFPPWQPCPELRPSSRKPRRQQWRMRRCHGSSRSSGAGKRRQQQRQKQQLQQ